MPPMDLFDQADAPDPAAEIRRLTALINHHDYCYHVQSQPEISDAEYDRLSLRLQTLEARHPDLVQPDSPLKRVGSDLSADFPEVRHSIPVLSLEKAYGPEEILNWVRRCSQGLAAQGLGGEFSCTMEQKMDGLSVVLQYQAGILVQALTRGNGETGNEVTANVRTIQDAPLRLTRPIDGIFRGEVYLRKADFQRLNAEADGAYVNPRNLAGGSLRRVKSSEVARIPLHLYIYEGLYPDAPATHAEIMADLGALGFSVNPRLQVLQLPADSGSLQGLLEEEARNRPDLPWEIDGLVFKVNEIALREPLGYTGHHPRWALAYKFDNPQGVSRIRGLEVQVGRSGRVTPVARIDPVQVGGATIQNVTLHNQDYIDGLEIGIGDLVTISRRGEVIPAVEAVVEKVSTHIWQMPQDCPACHTILVREGAHHFCPDWNCPARSFGRLVFFAARDQMDIEGLGPETVQVLREQNLVSDIADIYSLDCRRLEGLPGWGEKKAQRLAQGIDLSRSRPFSRVLWSLGLPDLGPRLVRRLMDAGYRTVQSLLDLAGSHDYSALTAISGVGERTARRVLDELDLPRTRLLLQALQGAGLAMAEALEETPEPVQGIFSGQVWCVTGSFVSFKPRGLALQAIRDQGGEASEDFSLRVTHLLAGEKAGSKLQKAQGRGVQVVDEDSFLGLLAAASPVDRADGGLG